MHWKLCRSLWASVNEFVPEINDSPAFWHLTLNAHREVTVFRLGRLYDTQKGALSLPTLVDTIAANVHLFQSERFRVRLKDNPFVQSLAESARTPDALVLESDARSVAEADPLVQRVVALRNRVLAHRDPRVVLGTMADPTSEVEASHIDELVTRAAELVNRYSDLFKASTHMMSMFGQSDYRKVLDHIRSDLAQREREIEAEIERDQNAG